MKKASCKVLSNGITSLLCADSKIRNSYFLNEEEILNSQEYIQIENLSLYETDFRFDDYKNFEKLFSENVDEKEMIVFTHEWLLHVPIRKNIVKWFDSLLKSIRVKSNIDFFFTYYLNNDKKYVYEF